MDFERGGVTCRVFVCWNEYRRSTGYTPFDIPGRAKHEPGIHTHDRGYGFRACAKWRIPE
jgi:hypothetical protein